MSNFIKFPNYSNYPSVLHIGFKSNEVKDVVGKKILVILDVTGSMDEHINCSYEGTKIAFAKKIIAQLIEVYPFSVFEILPFAETVKDIVSFDNIPKPDNCTKFSPIPDALKKIISPNSDYIASIFMSDGIPSEQSDIALNAIKLAGSFCREMKTNTITVAIGSDADGQACALFTGNRGYNCFVKFDKEIESVVNDVVNGIKCNFTLVENNWIPIESNGKYYYIDNNIGINEIEPDIESVKKYISLVIQEEICNFKHFDTNKLIEFIKVVAEYVKDEKEKNDIIEFFTKSIIIVNQTINDYAATPSGYAATKQAYQTYSVRSTGV
jgi:hypothetical protein